MTRWMSIGAVAVVACVQACATVYTAPDLDGMVQSQREIAVIPFGVSIAPPRRGEFDAELLATLAEDEGFAVQSELYSRFLRQVSRGNYDIEIQDIYETNRILAAAGLGYDALVTVAPDELASVLGVDAIVSGHISRSEPMSNGAAVGLAFLGVAGRTNEVTVDLMIHDGATGTLMWKYNHELGGSIGSSPDQLAEALMRKVSRRVPYRD